jgi:hypothetical protein
MKTMRGSISQIDNILDVIVLLECLPVFQVSKFTTRLKGFNSRYSTLSYRHSSWRTTQGVTKLSDEQLLIYKQSGDAEHA